MYRLMLLAILATATAVWAQESTPDDESAAETETVDESAAEELDDLVLDGQEDHTEDDEDVFKPTDVVSYSQSVAFPVDI
jgi:hypothetical protein